jgi:hypothetical protein
MDKYSKMSPLEIWYERITAEDIIALLSDAGVKARIRKRIAKAKGKTGSEIDSPELAGRVGGHSRIHDSPPLIFHLRKRWPKFQSFMDDNIAAYRTSLADDRRALLDRYQVVDAALKVVGIGSVGTRCAIALMMSVANEPLFLQFKEARKSVLERYAGKNPYPHHGQRVVMGQRLMQPATDVFLGWITTTRGLHGYVRQLRDAKAKPNKWPKRRNAEDVRPTCGSGCWRGPRKGGQPIRISGYLGS